MATEDATASVQFRIRFEQPADSVGSQGILFFRTDSNTNEAGIFELEISPNP